MGGHRGRGASRGVRGVNAKLHLGIAAGVAAVLAAMLFFDVRRERATEEQKKLLALEPKDAVAWTVACSGDTVAAHRTQEGQWWLSSPVRALADQDRVLGFLNALAVVRRASAFEAPDTLLGEYGLDPPHVRVTLFWEGDSQVILWGDRAPVGTGTYCRMPPGQSVWLVSGASGDQLCMTLDEAREAGLFTLPSYDVAEVLLELPKRKVHLRQRGDRWWVDEPIALRAKSSSVEDLVRTLSDEQALGFPEVAAASLGQAVVRVTLANRDSTQVEQIELEASGGPVRLGLRGLDSTVVEVRGDWVDEFGVSPEKLRDRGLADLTPYTVSEILCRTGDRTVELVKDTVGTWRLVEPVNALADGRRLGDLLTRLSEAEADFYLQDGAPLAHIGLEPPTLALVVEQEGQAPCSLFAGARGDRGRYAISAFGELCVVSAGAFDGWEAPADSFRRWDLLTALSYEVEEIKLSREGSCALWLKRQGQTWTQAEPRRGRWEGEPIGSWIEDGRRLRGSGLLAAVPGEASIELTLGLWGDKTARLQLGQMGDTLWARLPGEDAMCVGGEAHAWATRLLPADERINPAAETQPQSGPSAMRAPPPPSPTT